MEIEEQEERRRRMNPIVRDGGGHYYPTHSFLRHLTDYLSEFQYRFRQVRTQATNLARSPRRLSTF